MLNWSAKQMATDKIYISVITQEIHDCVFFFTISVSKKSARTTKKKRFVQFVQHYPLLKESNTKVDIYFTLVALNV